MNSISTANNDDNANEEQVPADEQAHADEQQADDLTAQEAEDSTEQPSGDDPSDDASEPQPPVPEKLLQIVEAALLAAGQPLTVAQLSALFAEHERPTPGLIRETLALLEEDCAKRGVELKQVASGYRLQVREELQPWISRLWQERPKRYSRALLETLALIAYRQPVTRAEIEDVRGVSVSSSIIRTLLEREWVREVGHRDVPGRPVLLGTTKTFLDYFNLKSLDELPTLAEIQDLDTLEPELALGDPGQPANDAAPQDATDASNQQPTDDEDHPPGEQAADDESE